MSRIIAAARGQSRVIRSQTPEDRAADMLLLAAREAEIAERFERQSRRLALDIAASLLRVSAAETTALVTQTAERAFGRLPREHSATLRVHPLDRPAVEGFVASRSAPLHIVVDSSLERGGCIVESAVGRVDARLETQLAAYARVLGVPSANGER